MKPKTYMVGTLTALAVAASTSGDATARQVESYRVAQLKPLKLSPKVSTGAASDLQRRKLELNKPGAEGSAKPREHLVFYMLNDRQLDTKTNPRPAQTNVRSRFKRNVGH